MDEYIKRKYAIDAVAQTADQKWMVKSDVQKGRLMIMSNEPKHTKGDLAQMQSLPLESKIIMTKRRIRDWYEHFDGQVYVSFSGGKDSTVLKHIVDSMYDDVPALFVNTGLEYPEIQKFAMSQPNVITVRPEMRFDEVIKKYGYPVISKNVSNKVYGAKNSIKNGNYSLRLCQLGVRPDDYGGLNDSGQFDYVGAVNGSKFSAKKYRFLLDADFNVSDYCCNIMKKRPAHRFESETGRMPIIATLASESINREKSWLKSGCNAFYSKKPKSQPMSFWTEQDVLKYIKKYDVPYCSVYGDIVSEDECGNSHDLPIDFLELLDFIGASKPLKTTGCDRTGCIFCMFGCHLEKEPNRFQRLKRTHPRQYEYCIGGGEMVDGKWQPNKEGLGLGHVLDYIGVPY